MEPDSCVADVRPGQAEIWGGNAWPIWAQRNIAEALGMKVEQVTFHVIPSGGSFGRRVYHDPHVHAAQAQRLGKPVKLMCLREEDIKQGRSRPVSLHHVRATVRGGDVVSFEHRMACAELDFRFALGDVVSTAVAEHNNDGSSPITNPIGSGRRPSETPPISAQSTGTATASASRPRHSRASVSPLRTSTKGPAASRRAHPNPAPLARRCVASCCRSTTPASS